MRHCQRRPPPSSQSRQLTWCMLEGTHHIPPTLNLRNRHQILRRKQRGLLERVGVRCMQRTTLGQVIILYHNILLPRLRLRQWSRWLVRMLGRTRGVYSKLMQIRKALLAKIRQLDLFSGSNIFDFHVLPKHVILVKSFRVCGWIHDWVDEILLLLLYLRGALPLFFQQFIQTVLDFSDLGCVLSGIHRQTLHAFLADFLIALDLIDARLHPRYHFLHFSDPLSLLQRLTLTHAPALTIVGTHIILKNHLRLLYHWLRLPNIHRLALLLFRPTQIIIFWHDFGFIFNYVHLLGLVDWWRGLPDTLRPLSKTLFLKTLNFLRKSLHFSWNFIVFFVDLTEPLLHLLPPLQNPLNLLIHPTKTTSHFLPQIVNLFLDLLFQIFNHFVIILLILVIRWFTGVLRLELLLSKLKLN